MGLKELLGKVLEADDEKSDGKIIRTIIAKKEWIKEFKALLDETNELKNYCLGKMRDLEHRRKILWGKISEETGEPRDMHFNQDEGTLEVKADKWEDE